MTCDSSPVSCYLVRMTLGFVLPSLLRYLLSFTLFNLTRGESIKPVTAPVPLPYMVAIHRYGEKLEEAASWLLEGEVLHQQDAPSALAASSTLDVSAEISRLQDVQPHLGCSDDAIAAAVMECKGDPKLAVVRLYERLLTSAMSLYLLGRKL